MCSLIRGPLALTFLLLAVGCATPGASSSPVDDYLQAVLEKHHVPGVAVAIVRDGKVEKLSAYGVSDLESGARAGPDTAERYAAAIKELLAYAPGERSEYGLTSFVVLTHVLVKATGQGFEELLRTRIFERAGGVQRKAWFLYSAHTYPADGVFSCVQDLARWAGGKVSWVDYEWERVAAGG